MRKLPYLLALFPSLPSSAAGVCRATDLRQRRPPSPRRNMRSRSSPFSTPASRPTTDDLSSSHGSRDCMHARGWTFPDPVAKDELAGPSHELVLLEADRAANGYVDVVVDLSSREPLVLPDDATKSEAFLNDLGNVLGGASYLGGSCSHDAAQRVALMVPLENTAVQLRLPHYYEMLDSAEELRTATKAWAICMVDRGWTVDNPAAANRVGSAQADSRKIATDDMACYRDTLWEARTAADRVAINALLKEFPEYETLASRLGL